jgi:hypothetical protein
MVSSLVELHSDQVDQQAGGRDHRHREEGEVRVGRQRGAEAVDAVHRVHHLLVELERRRLPRQDAEPQGAAEEEQ